MSYGHDSGRDGGCDGGGYGHEGYTGSGTTKPFSQPLRAFASDSSNLVGAFIGLAVGGFVITAVVVILHGLLFTN